MRDHRTEISQLLDIADLMSLSATVDDGQQLGILALKAAASLISCHDDTGIDLNAWPECLALVEHLLGHPFEPDLKEIV